MHANLIHTISSANLPLLLEIPDAPRTLYISGKLPHADNKILTVVGSRAMTPYGREACEALIHELSGYPISIVSGLALGVDACAHSAALTANLHTIAIPGSGLSEEVLYPRANRGLAYKIVNAGGALISEFEPNFRATEWSFPKRNRIMAGIAHATLVIEANEKSGTLITARLATDYNREVMVVPGSIFNPHSSGPHMLLRLGATPVRNGKDILLALGFSPQEKPSASNVSLSPDEQRVINLIQIPLPRDALIRNLNKPIGEANALLAAMELKGLIKETMGEIRCSL